jgi:hypothetical protein
MNRILIACGLLAVLAGCANSPSRPPQTTWNDGIWNSVLGYRGPSNDAGSSGGP